MIGLLDVNTLVALFDPCHVHHELAHQWFGANRGLGWATCPVTENGLVRVLSSPSYPGRRTTVSDAIRRLEQLRRSGDHVFWTDSVSLCDLAGLRPTSIRGHRQITDVYLLALAWSNRGRLVTLDRSIMPACLASVTADNLIVIS